MMSFDIVARTEKGCVGFSDKAYAAAGGFDQTNVDAHYVYPKQEDIFSSMSYLTLAS
jgi:hypothetical protein